MLQLYVIPVELHQRVIDADPNLYAGLGKVESIKESFSLTDQVAMSEATKRFTYTFESNLPVSIGKCPLGLYSSLPEYERQAEELVWQLQYNAQKDKDKLSTTYSYGLYPVGGDVWVVVEQRVHETSSHLTEQSLVLNRDFYADLIGALYHYVPFHELAASSLFSNYLKATELSSR